ncbi:MAG: TonB-dependent receptor plug domain-containing protein [Bacteroidota bacterium]|nr:TonB-dependent receptor plug domain-containing protein [Bacteroidota bacterium]
MIVICFISNTAILAQIISSTDILQEDTTISWSITGDPVFVHASRLRNPFSVSTISSQDILNVNLPSIEPLLNRLPGIWMQTGALNTNRISIRGVGYREPFATTGIKIYLDDIPLTNGAGESSIEDIHPFILSGIEVWRGPTSALWGSGLGGMIQLKTATSRESFAHSRIQIGSFGREEFDQGISFHFGKNQQHRTILFYQYLDDDGYRENNHYRKHSFTWMQKWVPGNTVEVSSFLHAIDLKAYLPSSINQTMFNENPEKAAPQWIKYRGNEDYTKWIGGLNVMWIPGPAMVYKATVFTNIFNSVEVRPFNVLDEGSDGFGTRHRFQLEYARWGHLNVGIEYFRERAHFTTFQTLDGGVPGNLLLEMEETRSSLNSFLQNEFDINDQWIVFAGVNVSANNLAGNNDEITFPVSLYPTAGTSYLIGDEIAVSGSVSRGFSNHSIDDLINSDGIIMEGLIPETGWNEEVAIRFGDDKQKTLRIGFYNLDIKNSILVQTEADGSFSRYNGGSSILRGVETEYQTTFFSDRFTFSGSYTLQWNTGTDSGANRRLPGYPTHRTFNELTYHSGSLRLSISHQYVSEVFLNDLLSQKGEAYNLVNANAGYEFILIPSWKMRLQASIHNVFDTAYSAMYQINAAVPSGGLPRYYYPGKPLSVYASISFDHNF